ncbi:MAG: hypothetical protein ACYC08_05460, partial [Armatimonadota bacterium]
MKLRLLLLALITLTCASARGDAVNLACKFTPGQVLTYNVDWTEWAIFDPDELHLTGSFDMRIVDVSSDGTATVEIDCNSFTATFANGSQEMDTSDSPQITFTIAENGIIDDWTELSDTLTMKVEYTSEDGDS